MVERNESKLLSVAESISEARAVDWETLEGAEIDATETEVLRELRLLDRIATFHRATEDPHPPEPEHAPPIAAEDDLQTWGHLAILEKIGEGAFGTVYRARDSKLQREVALKLLWPAPGTASSSRALKEARLLARIRHANVATVYGADQIRGRVGLWMEFVKGRTLANIVRTSGPFGAREAALVGLDLCRALAAVHAAGLVHGDVKAHNVMREEGGRTVLMDFGTGKDVVRDDAMRHGTVDDFAGTPLYLAPEVFAGQPRTKATDVYSLGVLLYHLVTDAYPVAGRTRDEVARAHDRRERHQLRDVRPDLPQEFVQVVERALVEDPRERYQTVGALEAGLARFLGAPSEINPSWMPVRVGRTALTMAALVAAMALGSAYWFMPGRTPPAGSDAAPAAAGVIPRPAAAATGAPGEYQIQTAVYREAAAGQEIRLRPGARVSPGDKLFVEVRASVPTFVYIVGEDEQGESLLLFPLPGQDVVNPLPAGKANRLPGVQNGEEVFWQVDKAGGREHMMIFASPERLTTFDKMFASLPRPERSKPIQSARLTRETLGALRSIGGLVPAAPAGPQAEGPLSKQFSTPAGEVEETARGVWIRQVTLENPVK